MKKLLMLVFVTLVIGTIAPITPSYGQSSQATATGFVYDASTGEPIMGAVVVALDRNNTVLGGTTTDTDGNYSLDVSWGTPYKIQVSFIGYIQVTAPEGKLYLQGRSECRIGLRSDTKLLEWDAGDHGLSN